MTVAIDIFTASPSTDFAYAYTTRAHIVLSHCDLVTGICFVRGKDVFVQMWAPPFITCSHALVPFVFGSKITMK